MKFLTTLLSKFKKEPKKIILDLGPIPFFKGFNYSKEELIKMKKRGSFAEIPDPDKE